MVRNPKNPTLYKKARALRKKGLSYRVISNLCQTSKSNISLWCKDIKLSKDQKNKLLKNKSEILKLGSKKLHEKRKKEIEEIKESAKKQIKNISNNSFFLGGIMIYWGEGAKTIGVSITNSDKRMILFMLKWFEVFLNIDIKKNINAHLHLHSKQNDVEIKKYWPNLTGIPIENFGKSYIKKSGTGHRTKKIYNGTIRIRITGKGVENLRYKILTWIDEIYNKTITPC